MTGQAKFVAALALDKSPLNIDELVAVARHRQPVTVSDAGRQRVARTRCLIARWIKEKRVI